MNGGMICLYLLLWILFMAAVDEFCSRCKFAKKKKAWENLSFTNESGGSVPPRPRAKHGSRLQCSDE